MNMLVTPDVPDMPAEFKSTYERQQRAYRSKRNPSYEERRQDLRQLHRLIAENHDALISAVSQDYGGRASFETKLAELLGAQDAALDAIKHLRGWMKPSKRSVDLTQYPLAKAWTFPQPVGVVGIVVPWNFPIAMAFQPMICAFAAGNRVMVKMSENSGTLARLLKQLAARYFPEDKLAFFEDGGGRGPAFTQLPFDHLFFTGSPATGKAVMANAARNLTPVTLELGGKSPCIVGPDYSMKKAAERIMWAKMFNAGQICTNVDYLMLPEGRIDEFIHEAQLIAGKRYPDILNGDYTAIIDQRQYDRIQATLADALARGATAINLCVGQSGDPARRIFPPHAVLGVTESMEIMQREIFGPLLPIMTYSSKEEVVEYIGDRHRPLALYVYSDDKALQDYYLNNTISGGVGINESVLQGGLHSLPFGGTGHSGMGHYHGLEGFLTFSKLRPVFKQSPWRSLDMLMPPYSGSAGKMLNFMLKRKS
ncbi:coniferyl-aldehyde dehydrogenase [Paucibacter oligotrophus]|uniref:Aldehyde dehydrogenase n=1 Tax=Roseateles oligotrophus TaxID=1769250 RepID=A0A840LAJ4_9BURK|nr:coniferyl aldehyde dehydrogenase [Roseateles oligotrophus]MBB4843682.1 coniferyl-aldehyde dehydrogenase [Roseateles oligotrophus]